MHANEYPPPDPQAWTEHAACRGMNPNLFIPAKEDAADRLSAHAKQVCAGCPVSSQCLEANIAEPLGVWGGLTASERRNLRRRRRRAERKASA